jgi:crossover junction endodeoxyribonuclease RuvC
VNVVTLALDLGTNTGFALLRQDERIESGTVRFPKDPKEGEGARFIRFRQFLLDTKAANPHLRRVVYERVHHVGPNQAYASQLYGGFLALVLMFCEHHQLEHDGYQIQAIKKAWTGRGDAKKPEMIARCKALGFNPGTDNEADAIALLHVAMKTAPPVMEPRRPRLKPSADTKSAALALLPAKPF